MVSASPSTEQPGPCPNPDLTAASGTSVLSIFQKLWGSSGRRGPFPGLRPSETNPSSFLFGKGPKFLSVSAIHLEQWTKCGISMCGCGGESREGFWVLTPPPLLSSHTVYPILKPVFTQAQSVGTMHTVDCGGCPGQSDGDRQGTGTQLWGWQNNQSSSNKPGVRALGRRGKGPEEGAV